VGYSHDLAVRLSDHNSGISNYTSKAKDWQLKYPEEFPTREQAMKREREIKAKKSREIFGMVDS
jgi:putative endonuclease